MKISIRLEEEKDFRKVEFLTREAFWDLYSPGCCEHLIVHKIRNVPAFVKELSYIAEEEYSIVGSIIYSKAKVINDQTNEFEVLCMGPISVLPSYQRKGIGSLLMTHSLETAKELGFKAVIIFGNPDYYKRFGFINAENYNIKTSKGENFDAFMVLELVNGALNGISGKFYEDKVFEIEDKELELFEGEFPFKEKHITATQFK
jgi:predicted N-acetyltransferase YhbS